MLPAEASIVAAADGAALAAWRRVVDAARPYAPAAFGCVIDAALSADAAALAHGESGTTIVVITKAAVAGCPALARVASDTYVATLGDSTIEHGLGDHWARARPYLASAPIAVAAELGPYHVLGQADAVAAWLSIDAGDAGDAGDASDAAAVKTEVDAAVVRWRSLASKVSVKRTGSQVLVRATHLDPDEAATIAGDVLKDLDSPHRAAAPVFACPPAGGIIVHCTTTAVTVTSLAEALAQIAAAAPERVVAHGEVIGVRLAGKALSLDRGDIVLGIDGHRITSASQLVELANSLPKRLSVAVRRGEIDAVIDVAEE